MELLGAGVALSAILGFLALAVLLGFLIGAVFLWISARLVGIPDVGFGKACIASLLTALACYGLSVLLSIIPVVGTLGGYLLGAALSVYIIQEYLKASLGQAILCYLCNAVAQVMAAIASAFVCFGGLVFLGAIAGAAGR